MGLIALSINISLLWSENELHCCTWKLNSPKDELSRYCIVGFVGFASRQSLVASFPLKQESEESGDVLGYLSRIFIRKTTTGTRLPRLFRTSNQLRRGLVHTPANLKRRALRNSDLAIA
jgi:hypothetical protein